MSNYQLLSRVLPDYVVVLVHCVFWVPINREVVKIHFQRSPRDTTQANLNLAVRSNTEQQIHVPQSICAVLFIQYEEPFPPVYARIQDDGGLRWQRSTKLPGRGHSFTTEVVDSIPDWIAADETLMGKYGLFNLRQFLHEYCQPFQFQDHLHEPNVIYYLVIRNPEVERVNVSILFSSADRSFLGRVPQTIAQERHRRICGLKVFGIISEHTMIESQKYEDVLVISFADLRLDSAI